MKYKSLREIAEEWFDKTVPYPVPDPQKLQGHCVQFIRFCLRDLYCLPQWNSVIGAADFWQAYEQDKNINAHWDKIPNSPSFIPQEHDICIWNKNKGGGFGHIGIVYGSDQSVKMLTCLESNWKPFKVSIVTHNYNDVLGFFRRKQPGIPG